MYIYEQCSSASVSSPAQELSHSLKMATRGRRAWYWSFVSAAMVAVVAGDFAADRAECASNLVGLSTCLTYVQGTGSAPTPDCCSGLEQVVGKSPKCLCVLIKDRDEPGLGFKFNVTRAMSLPDVCHSSANISDCPSLFVCPKFFIFSFYFVSILIIIVVFLFDFGAGLLNLPRDSKDAQIFEQFGNSSSSHGISFALLFPFFCVCFHALIHSFIDLFKHIYSVIFFLSG